MALFFVRHGNTFEAGDPVLRVGSRTDLPLTKRGISQAETCGESLVKMKIEFSSIISGPLIRHRQHVLAIAEKIGFAETEIKTDPRLQEIDYGEWEGKTDEDIRKMGFAKELEAYNQNGIWPPQGRWGETETSFRERVSEFFSQITETKKSDENILVVTSGGVLRVLYEMGHDTRPSSQKNGSKVSTGSVCIMKRVDQVWKIEEWNLDPAILS